ncbi:hypothetical protein OIE73_29690 [Streptomyces hirsutus]|uniref:Uncharacterized protein n=1 Tax=Streptomyces hirsutus TaxID=35620 RepID=A0ABZ1GW23_9ACTN|nr:hypothetical protein [Streptomyces hirsutus]WSD09512.1 hypothetical protein OIE73_29690 [Streptomyces hirsutus]
MRTGAAPRAMAGLRSLAIGALRLAGYTSIAAGAPSPRAERHPRPLATLGIT